MTGETIRFGVVGLGRGQSFVRVCRAAQGAEVTALYDIDTARVTAAAEGIGATPFDTFEDFLNADFDVVVVASPLPFHAGQAVAALRAGKHVLSEVTACDSMDDARALVEAARESDGIYMMSENFCYLDEVELLRRMHADGRFGEVYYGEGEYLHDCKELWFDREGNLTWRSGPRRSVYCTHSLGPLLAITGDRVTSVSALAVPGGKYHPDVTNPTMMTMQMTTAAGRVLKVRVDSASSRPHQMAYYALQGTKGAFESWRGCGDQSKVWLEDTHEPSRLRDEDGARWHPAAEWAARYIPDRLDAPAEAHLGGHGTSEYWLLKDVMAAVRGEIAPPIDVYRALDFTLPGILAMESARGLGTPVAVPDPRVAFEESRSGALQETVA